MKGVSLLIRATCEQFRFTLPYNVSQIEKVKILFWQKADDGEEYITRIEKGLDDCYKDQDSKQISVTLNQEETRSFRADRMAFVQLRGLTIDGIAFGNIKEPIVVYPVEDDSILE